jgi:hypothetical protein
MTGSGASLSMSSSSVCVAGWYAAPFGAAMPWSDGARATSIP